MNISSVSGTSNDSNDGNEFPFIHSPSNNNFLAELVGAANTNRLQVDEEAIAIGVRGDKTVGSSPRSDEMSMGSSRSRGSKGTSSRGSKSFASKGSKSLDNRGIADSTKKRPRSHDTLDVADMIEILAMEDTSMVNELSVTDADIDEAIDQVLRDEVNFATDSRMDLDTKRNTCSRTERAQKKNINIDDGESISTINPVLNLHTSSLQHSVERLLKKLKQVPSFFHRICLHKWVTFEMIEYILELFPEAAHIPTIDFCSKNQTYAYPIHLACYNHKCSNSIIELLAKKNPKALSHHCIIHKYVGDKFEDCMDGLPLNFYLSQETNRAIAIVKMLVEIYPRALTTVGNKSMFTPLHDLLSSRNTDDLYETVKYLIDSEPLALRLTDRYGQVPLHIACTNKNINSKIVQMLLDYWPESIAQIDDASGHPIHTFCYANDGLNEMESLKILAILIEASPGSVQAVDSGGDLPLHIATDNKTAAFSKALIDSYPESIRIRSKGGILPLHQACRYGNIDTVKYLLGLYPESIHMKTKAGFLPIHEAASRIEGHQVEILRVLLSYDPDGASRASTRTRNNHHLPLHMACRSCKVNLGAVQHLYDYHSWAICKDDRIGRNPLDIARTSTAPYLNVIKFLEAQMVYAHKAQDMKVLSTFDRSGQLLLHCELRKNAPLGTIKLIVKGYPAALEVPDHQGLLPLHIACEFCTVDIVQFLFECNDHCSDCCDFNKNSLLHVACRGGKFSIVRYLLDRCIGSVSEHNVHRKLPIHLLCESRTNEQVDCSSLEYTETIWQLLLAYPGTVTHFS